jgi:NAD(P)-dependent dehydrogenase (short-subunit alcohol dehydrogenase family)
MKTAVITGANRGLGLELVKKFAAEGWQVIAACRDTASFPPAEVKEQVQIAELDVSSEQSIDSFISSVKTVDLLINNAGIYDDGDEATFAKTTKIFETNVFGPRILTERLKSTVSQLKTIVSISSNAGRFARAHTGARWAYGASKAALNFAMTGFASLHPDIVSILVDPGWMHTDMGGHGAPIDPAQSAAKIFTLATKADQLENGRMYDTYGNVLEW